MQSLCILLIAALLSAVQLRADSVLAGSAAVLPFTNVSSAPAASSEWIGESIAEALRESLVARGSPVIPRMDVMEAYKDLRLRPTAELTQASVLKLGQALNADDVIYGTFRVDPAAGTLTIQAVVSDRARALLSTPIDEAGPLAELDRLEAHLNWKALSIVAPDLAGAETEFRSLRPPVRLAAEESFIRGWIALAPEQRESFYQQAVRADVRFSRPVLELGKIELGRKNYKAAAEWLLKVNANDVHYPEASFYLGVAKFHQNDYVAAQAAFERIVKTLPAPEVFNNLGVAESRRGQLHALSSFREALDVNPSHPDYHFNMGFMLFKTGQYEAAADRFRAVLDRNPGDQAATILLGRSLKGEGLRKGNASDARFEASERFKDTYDEPIFRAALAPAPEGEPE
ncbi:MAG: tetratricopeptide repeat protein [Bryobacteraceae bacterium]